VRLSGSRGEDVVRSARGEVPGRYDDGQLRTLQRRVRSWRAERGRQGRGARAATPAGEAAQTDFTWATELAVTIVGQLFVHMLCVFVLPYSNWRWASVCLSESIASIRHGVQRALFQLDVSRVASDRQLDRRDASDPGRQERHQRGPQQAPVQRGLPRDHAALRHESAHNGGGREEQNGMSRPPTAP